ncbi:MAG: DUF6528 family protein [Pirellulaceae bacterium]
MTFANVRRSHCNRSVIVGHLSIGLILLVSLTCTRIASANDDLICCGASEVFIIDPAQPNVKKWSWQAKDSPSIPTELRGSFRSTDDCKPFRDDLLLITSSGRGVALIERSTKKCLFMTVVRNAHSGCLLPQNQLAVAASYGADAIQFYDRKNEEIPAATVQEIELVGAHGTVWDAKRDCLWALGGEELVKVESDPEVTVDRRWSITARYKLPSSGGHDLSMAQTLQQLFVTTDTQVLKFDLAKQAFEPQTGFHDQIKIKSVDQHPETGRIVFHRASGENWWSDTIRFEDTSPITLAGERLYKIRWDNPIAQP